MKESELRARLKALYDLDVPEETHRAFMSAAFGEKEQTKMKAKLRLTPVLVILLALLLVSAACALVIGYSVTDYQGQGEPSAEFMEHVIDIHQMYENDALALTVNDAVYDGERIALAMDIAQKSGSVFIRPRLTAVADGVEYCVDVEGWRGGDFMSGFIFPDLHHPEMSENGFGMDGALWNVDGLPLPTGKVTWMLTLQLYRPVFEIVKDDTVFTGAEGEMEAYNQRCREAYRDGKLLVTDSGNLLEYYWGIQPETAIPEEEYWQGNHAEVLAAAGVLAPLETITCHFTTGFDTDIHLENLTGQRVTFGDAALVVEQVNRTFMYLQVRLYWDFGRTMTQEELDVADMPDGWTVYHDEDARLRGYLWEQDVMETKDGETRLTVSYDTELYQGEQPETLRFEAFCYDENHEPVSVPEYDFTMQLK